MENHATPKTVGNKSGTLVARPSNPPPRVHQAKPQLSSDRCRLASLLSSPSPPDLHAVSGGKLLPNPNQSNSTSLAKSLPTLPRASLNYSPPRYRREIGSFSAARPPGPTCLLRRRRGRYRMRPPPLVAFSWPVLFRGAVDLGCLDIRRINLGAHGVALILARISGLMAPCSGLCCVVAPS
jgi:hypothetical protein